MRSLFRTTKRRRHCLSVDDSRNGTAKRLSTDRRDSILDRVQLNAFLYGGQMDGIVYFHNRGEGRVGERVRETGSFY